MRKSNRRRPSSTTSAFSSLDTTTVRRDSPAYVSAGTSVGPVPAAARVRRLDAATRRSATTDRVPHAGATATTDNRDSLASVAPERGPGPGDGGCSSTRSHLCRPALNNLAGERVSCDDLCFLSKRRGEVVEYGVRRLGLAVLATSERLNTQI